MRRRSVAAVMVFITFHAGISFGCYQLYSGPTSIKATEIRGRVTLNQAALVGAAMELHRARNFSLEEVRKNGPSFEKAVIENAITDKNGQFRFGHIEPGKYWVLMTRPSHEKFAVQIESESSTSDHNRLLIAATDDWCTDVTVERAAN